MSDNHADAHVKPYLVVFGALAIFTAVSFIVYEAEVTYNLINKTTAFLIILGVAFVKAILVATYFMHLLFDWKRVFIMIVPALILGPMLMIVLLPDIVLSKLEHVPPPAAAQQETHPTH